VKVSRAKGQGRERPIVDAPVAARSIRYSHHDGSEFSLSAVVDDVKVRVELSLAEAEQIARDVAEFNARKSTP